MSNETAKVDNTTGTIRVLVVDDHPVVCEGVRLLVKNVPDVLVIGVASTGEEAIQQAQLLRPDVILLDLRLTDGLGLDFVDRILEVAPASNITIFTAHNSHTALRAIESPSIRGCLLKDVTPASFVSTLRKIVAGEKVIDQRISSDSLTDASQDGDVVSRLTPREYDVLRRAALGESNPEIADALGLTKNTVKSYMQSTLQKLGARNRVEAILAAQRSGLL